MHFNFVFKSMEPPVDDYSHVKARQRRKKQIRKKNVWNEKKNTNQPISSD